MHYIAKDTETGGFYPAIHALLSIGACCSWSPITFRVYITVDSQPGKIVEPSAAAVNGYSAEEWKRRGAVRLGAAMKLYADWLAARKAERRHAKFVCHNLEFDRSHLRDAERVTGIELPHRHDWRCSQGKFGELMDKGAIEVGSSGLERLGELSGFWGVGKRPETHDCLFDAQACLHGYLWLLEVEKREVETLRELYQGALKQARDGEDVVRMVQVYWNTPLGVEPPLSVGEVTRRLCDWLKNPGRAMLNDFSLVKWVRDGSLPDVETTVLVEQDGQEVSEGFVEGGDWYWASGGAIEGMVTAWAHVPEGPGLAWRLGEALGAGAAEKSDPAQRVPTNGKGGA